MLRLRYPFGVALNCISRGPFLRNGIWASFLIIYHYVCLLKAIFFFKKKVKPNVKISAAQLG